MEKENNRETKIIETLKLFNSKIRYEVLGEIAVGRRLITSLTYEDQPFVNLSAPLITEGRKYEEACLETISRKMKIERGLSLSMFTCPNGDATNIYENFKSVIPPVFNDDQVLRQRIPLLKDIFKRFRELLVPIQLNIVLGDNDFMTYYYPHYK